MPEVERKTRNDENAGQRYGVYPQRTLVTIYCHRYLRAALALACLVVFALASQQHAAQNEETCELKLIIEDAATKQRTPARVEVLNEHGKSFIAEDAIPVGGSCIDLEKPWQGTLSDAEKHRSRKVDNRYTNTEHFYSTGLSHLKLPPGVYRIKVRKGPEYRVHAQEVRLKAGQPLQASARLDRWIDMPSEGWYSADAHLHIPRPYKKLNASICKWMQAEDIHVANLLEWGNTRRFHNARQYAHGPDGLYNEGDYWLASGQENPRTWLLGHTMTLGASRPINYPDQYLIYKNFWEESKRQQALSGYCHYGIMLGGQNGLAIDLLDELLTFIEVMQFNRANYSLWYEALNLGVRLAPVAGTDYPCGPVLPGRERFFTQVDGPLTHARWLDGIRRGRTFVSNGPMLRFSVNGKGLSQEVSLPEAGRVRLEGSVRFDPGRDQVERLELVENGEVRRTWKPTDKGGEIRFDMMHQVDQTCWLALRAVGKKVDEALYPRLPEPSPSLAHTAAIYITVHGTPKLAEQRRAKLIAKAWKERLDALESRLSDAELPKLAHWPATADGIDLPHLKKNRDVLIQRIQTAKKRLAELAR